MEFESTAAIEQLEEMAISASQSLAFLSRPVWVITVTYGCRTHLLGQVLDRIAILKIGGVIVVDNASSGDLTALLRNLPNYLKVYHLRSDINLGSAGGYALGLKKAMSIPECRFVWLLDDDNLPSEDALKRMLAFYLALGEPKNCGFVANRGNWWGEQVACRGRPYRMERNSFQSFHFKRIPDLWRGLFRRAKNEPPLRYPIARIEVAPYGGLFLPKTVIQYVGYPNETYFLYGDDAEYTYRMTRSGINLFYCHDVKISDLEFSKHRVDISITAFFGPHASPKRIYLSVKNKARLEEMLVSKKVVWAFNAMVYIICLFVAGLISTRGSRILWQRMTLVINAVQEGRKHSRID